MLDNTTNRSISSRVLELLRETADDAQFTGTDLTELLGLPRNNSSISGFLSRAAKLGLIKFVGVTGGRTRKRYVYQIDNRHAVVNVRHKRGLGRHSGPRRGHKHLTEPVLDLQTFADDMVQMNREVEAAYDKTDDKPQETFAEALAKLPLVPSLADAMLELAARLESEARNMQNVGYVLQELVTDEDLLAEVARRFHRK